jgi:hypothetical protein
LTHKTILHNELADFLAGEINIYPGDLVIVGYTDSDPEVAMYLGADEEEGWFEVFNLPSRERCRVTGDMIIGTGVAVQFTNLKEAVDED